MEKHLQAAQTDPMVAPKAVYETPRVELVALHPEERLLVCSKLDPVCIPLELTS